MQVHWRPVLWGVGLQFCFALLVIRTTWGYNSFVWLGDRIQEFMAYTDEGSIFVFGESYEDHFFAFKVTLTKSPPTYMYMYMYVGRL